jgi:hypothetical protein
MNQQTAIEQAVKTGLTKPAERIELLQQVPLSQLPGQLAEQLQRPLPEVQKELSQRVYAIVVKRLTTLNEAYKAQGYKTMDREELFELSAAIVKSYARPLGLAALMDFLDSYRSRRFRIGELEYDYPQAYNRFNSETITEALKAYLAAFKPIQKKLQQQAALKAPKGLSWQERYERCKTLEEYSQLTEPLWPSAWIAARPYIDDRPLRDWRNCKLQRLRAVIHEAKKKHGRRKNASEYIRQEVDAETAWAKRVEIIILSHYPPKDATPETTDYEEIIPRPRPGYDDRLGDD